MVFRALGRGLRSLKNRLLGRVPLEDLAKVGKKLGFDKTLNSDKPTLIKLSGEGYFPPIHGLKRESFGLTRRPYIKISELERYFDTIMDGVGEQKNNPQPASPPGNKGNSSNSMRRRKLEPKEPTEYANGENGLLLRIMVDEKGNEVPEDPKHYSFDNGKGRRTRVDIPELRRDLGIPWGRKYLTYRRIGDDELSTARMGMKTGKPGYDEIAASQRLGLSREQIRILGENGHLATERASDGTLLYSRKSVNHMTVTYDHKTLKSMATRQEKVAEPKPSVVGKPAYTT